MAQQVTGTPPFGSFSGGPFDTVNNANLDAHFQVPIYNRAGRGLSFSYALAYDTAVWYPFTNGTATVWTPAANWGWTAQTQPQTGYLTFRIQVQSCIYGKTKYSWDTFTQFTYWDQLGAQHFFPGYVSAWPPDTPCGSGGKSSATITANDGSGYTLKANAPSDGSEVITEITDRSGNFINAPQQAPSGSGSVIDNNGNQISVTSSGSTTSFYDTLSSSVPVLTMSGSGTPSSPTTYSYTNPSGELSSYEVEYTDYSVRTNFGCSGVGEYSNASVPLVSSIRLPDGTAYSFTYEATPEASGSVTGRLHLVTLPTGGTITYTYTGGDNGIVCADGSTATLTRATPDGTWTYAHSEAGNAWTTTMTDPQANQTVMQFQAIYETERKSYQGSTSGTLLQTLDTCYNASASPCVSTAITLPIAQVSVTASLPGATTMESRTVTDYNAYGLVTERDEYGFGAGGPGALTRKSTIAYDTSLTNGIFDHPSSVQVFNGSGTLIAQSSYSYDQTAVTATSGTPQHTAVSGSRGNATTVQQMVAGSTNLVQKYTYFDTGNVDQATDTNSAVTSYTYGDCGNSFPTSISLPLSLTTSGAWNCNGAVQTSVTDANGNSASWTFNDPNFWRPTASTDPTAAVTGLSYFTSPSTGSESTLNFNGNASTVALRTTLDGLGRIHVNQRLQAPGSNNYDSAEIDYDSLGRPSRATVPYTGTAGQTNSTAPATKTAYDALGRPLTVTDGGGGVTTYTYTQNDVLIAIGPAPAGENLKRRQLEYDGLGRLTSVCEITAQTGAGSCGQTVAQTGYLTKYTYDALNDLLTVTQNAQSTSSQGRSYTYDGLGRLTAQVTPETAGKAATYNYDSDTTCGASQGDLMKRIDAAGNVTCYAYDALHRVTSVTYPSGPNAAATPTKTFVYDAATVDGTAMVNAKGRLAEAYTGPSSGKLTDEGFSYSARGEVTDSYEKTPHSGGTYGTYYHISASYWANGLLNTLNSNFSGMPTWTYTPDGEGRMNALLASGNQNALTGTNYNEFGQATGLSFGGASDTFGYDANTGRMIQYVFTTEYQGSLSGSLTWNPNGTLKQLVITDPFQASDNQTCNNSYDDLSRLLTNNCGSVWNQAFSYDAFGNIAFTGTASFQPTYNSATNRYNTLPASTPAYDANGNLTNYDGVTYTWDAEGKTSATSSPETITYDALGRLVEQYEAGFAIPTSDWVFAPGGVKLNITPSSAFAGVEARLQLPAGVAVHYDTGSNGPILYFHPDWLGSTRLLTDGTAGYVGAEIAISPFGAQYIGNGDNSLFTGAGEPDGIAGWTFPARHFLPDQARWLSPDPASLAAADPTNPQTWNRYAYVANNPLSNVDPSGMASCTSTNNCGLFVGSAPGPASWNDPRFTASGGPGGQYTSLGQLTASATPTAWNDGWLYGNSDIGSVTFSAEGLALAPAHINSDPLPTKNCIVSPASAGQYVSATAQVAGMTANFFSGMGPGQYTFGSNSAVSNVMAQSGPFQDVLSGLANGKVSDWENFGAPGYSKAGGNPVAQFVGSFGWNASPAGGGVNVTLTNVTSFRSLMDDHGPAYERFPVVLPGGPASAPMGNIRQTITIRVVCH